MDIDRENLEKLWKQALDRVEARIGNERAMNIWIRPVKPVSLSNGILTVELPSGTFQRGFASFSDIIIDAFAEVSGSRPSIEVITGQRGVEREARQESSRLNPSFTFDQFVVGPCNRLAHAAALAVSNSPGTAYNPLFIHGGVGLGKTHLIQAIGHAAQERQNLRVRYIPCEFFINSFIQAIQHKATHAFRSTFRNLDFLLIDDIHYLAGKEGTQEEFFHTFNALYDGRKQIILSSDRPPKEIAFLEKRLVSRFEWGLVVDIQPPDFETRVAILKKKCENRDISLSDDILFHIAEHVKDNVRFLEGVLNRIVAYTSLLNRSIDSGLVDEVIRGFYQHERRTITIPLILEKVSAYFHLTPQDLLSKKRVRHILLPRQIAMFIAREMTDNSLTAIADAFDGKDHTTVLHAYKKIRRMIDQDDYIQDVVKRITGELRG